jgi:adenylate cyclase
VIARNTAFTFKGKNIDAKEIGKELGVRYVLEGSVQRDQNRVRVNAQLVDAASGAHSKNPDTVDLTMRGRAAIIQWNQQSPTKDSLVAVRAWFDRALEIDPNGSCSRPTGYAGCAAN